MTVTYHSRILKKISETVNDPLYRNAAFIFGITVINSATGFFFWLFAARLYTPTEVGISSSIISIAQVVGIIAGLGLGIGIVRFLPDSESPGSLITTSVIFTFSASIIVSFIYLRGIRIWTPNLTGSINEHWLPLGFIFLVIVINLGNLFQWIFIGIRNAGFALVQSLIMNFFRLFFLFILSKVSWGITLSVILGWTMALLASIFLFASKSKEFHFWPLISKKSISDLIPYSFGTYLADIFYLAPAFIAPPLMLEIFSAPYSAFTYIAIMIGNFITSPGISLSKSAFAEASNSTEKQESIMLQAFSKSILITIPISLIVFSFSKIFLGFFGSDYANEAFRLLQFIAIAAPFVVVINSYFYILRVEKRILELLLSSIYIFVTAIGLTGYLANQLGILSYGIGWLVSQITFLIFVVLTKKFLLKKL
jgi:O-antigen/teichoic acid export membrane protein